MRPVDLAREHGLSAQAVRNYEDAGILPPAERSDSGYRRYDALHAQALRTFLALRRGHGFHAASDIMRAIEREDREVAFSIIDLAHAELRSERVALNETIGSTETLSRTEVVRSGGHMTVGELARRLGLHAATLRTWEAVGILHPERDRTTGYRIYGSDSIRDAEIARQLRRGGYPLSRIAQFVDALRGAGGADALREFSVAWQERVTSRGRTLLAGAAELDRYLDMHERLR